MLSQDKLLAGIILSVDKPRQWTSFQAVNKIKSAIRNLYGLKKIKIGHAGTLDPLATGLLLVCIGKATKSIPQLQDGDKVYTGTMVLGATTPCFDLEQAVDKYYPYQHLSLPSVQDAAQQFVGTIMQVPPMFSAVKVDGQRAYEYARKDDPTVIIQPKPVNVYSFEILSFREGSHQYTSSSIISQTEGVVHPGIHLYDHPLGSVPSHLPQIDFRIHCGKGTYIRSLARDLGFSLGSGAFLSDLRRERIGQFTVKESIGANEVTNYLMNLSNI